MEQLEKNYNNSVEAYVKAFCEMYGFNYDHPSKHWVGGEVGGICDIADYSFGFSDIKLCVDRKAAWDDVIAWYDYTTEAALISEKIVTPNLKSWLNGCPRHTKEHLEQLRTARRRVDEAKSYLYEEIERLRHEQTTPN